MFSQARALSHTYWDLLDDNWKEVILDAIGAEDEVETHFFYYAEQVESLDLYGTGIDDLSPLHLFANLRSLDISATAVRDLSPLQYVTHLEELHAAYCHPFSLTHLQPCTYLKKLDLSYPRSSHTSWQSLDQLPHLAELYINRTGIASVVDLLMLDRLQVLSLSFNSITDVEKTYLRELLPHAQLIF